MQFLVAEDDLPLGTFLTRGLGADGHQVTLASDGQEAIERFLEKTPDLVILDLNLPKRDGIEVLRFFRSITIDTPVLILTGRNDIKTKVKCFDLGADDFVSKPFSLVELQARCRILMRRRRDPNLILRQRDLEVNRVERSVSRNGQLVSLTNKEFALLEYLLLNRGRAVSRSVLLERIWSMRDTSTNVVDVYVNYLRRKLGDAAGRDPLIQTVRGEGYAIGLHL